MIHVVHVTPKVHQAGWNVKIHEVLACITAHRMSQDKYRNEFK